MRWVVELPNNLYRHITNTAWVRIRLCKLQKGMHSTRSRKWYSLPVAWPWSVISSTTKTGRHNIAEILLKVVLNTKKSNKINKIPLVGYLAGHYVLILTLILPLVIMLNATFYYMDIVRTFPLTLSLTPVQMYE